MRDGEMKSEKSMPERSVIHNTFVIERNFPATVQRVFAAFSDPVKKRRWFAEGDEFKVESFDLDFRVGGHERSQFLVQGMVCTNDTVYLDIVPERRIVFAYTMTLGEKRISSSQATVELLPTANGTDLIVSYGAGGILRGGRRSADAAGWLDQAAWKPGEGIHG